MMLQSKEREERVRRFREMNLRRALAVYAYSYEFLNESLVSDFEFDHMSKQVDTTIVTDDKDLDTFFKEHFEPCTGMWIYKHPHLEEIKKEAEHEVSLISR